MHALNSLFDRYRAIVFFDTETTGLDANKNQIIELAAIRVERDFDGEPVTVGAMDDFVRLPEGERLPEEIIELTGITDAMLEEGGISESKALDHFSELLSSDRGPVLLVAHNAQFDLLFAESTVKRHDTPCAGYLANADYLDTLTVFKDRHAYPHRLANAIEAYNLKGKVQNTHRAIDDVTALYEITKAMDSERDDLALYVNLFGYNPKYGVSGRRIGKIRYLAQGFHNYMVSEDRTLYAFAKALNWN